MKICYNIIALFLIVFNACKYQPDQPALNDFNTVIEIVEYDSIYSNNDISIIIKIECYNNLLITSTIASKDDTHFSFFDLEKGELFGNWGQQGQGPNEFLQISGRFSIIDSQLVFIDWMKKEINYVQISSILNNEKTLNIKKESYPYTVDFRPTTDIVIINDKKIALGSFSDSRFGVLDEENNIIDCPSDYPFNYESITGIYKGAAFNSMIESNVEQSKFVISTFASDIFEIYQIKKHEINRIYLSPLNHIPKIKKSPRRNFGYSIDYDQSIGGLLRMSVSKDLICFSYTSKSYNESSNSRHLSNEILCFDWDGKKIKKYILPFPINTFCIDRDIIYGAREYDNETVIYKFKMI